MRLINKLPGLQQTILRMKHVDGFEVEEIAGLTGSTPEAVRMNLFPVPVNGVREQFFKNANVMKNRGIQVYRGFI